MVDEQSIRIIPRYCSYLPYQSVLYCIELEDMQHRHDEQDKGTMMVIKGQMKRQQDGRKRRMRRMSRHGVRDRRSWMSRTRKLTTAHCSPHTVKQQQQYSTAQYRDTAAERLRPCHQDVELLK
jgi:hypothetical protein